VFASDSAGHATLVSWNNGLTSIVAVDGSLTTNTWGKVTPISGSDQFPNYFDYAMSSTGTAIVLWSGHQPQHHLARRNTKRARLAWNAPATAGTSFDGGGVPDSVAINGAGEAAVVFHGYSSDFLTFIQYTNTYHP
jgi:hypothetical protein